MDFDHEHRSNIAAGHPVSSIERCSGRSTPEADIMAHPIIPTSDLIPIATPNLNHVRISGVSATATENCIVVPGWKKRNVGVDGPDTRSPPSKKTAIERRLLVMKDHKGAEIFEHVVGTDFDSSKEAYDFYNLYSWEQGFGIRRGKGRVNSNKYRSMHELLCQCAGKNGKENSLSCNIECKAIVQLLHTKDHGWYVSVFVKEHNHRLSVGYEEKIQWNSHVHIDPIAFDFAKNIRSNNISVSKVYNILSGAEWNSQAVPYRKQVLRTLCAKFSQETIKDDLTKIMKLLQDMKSKVTNLKVEIDVDGDGRVRTMLWVTGKNRQHYIHFGDVVTFDITYKTNL